MDLVSKNSTQGKNSHWSKALVAGFVMCEQGVEAERQAKAELAQVFAA